MSEPATFTFNSRPRAGAVLTHAVFQSAFVVTLFLLLAIAATTSWATWFFFFPASGVAAGIAALISAAAAACALSFIFVTTYYPYRPAPQTVSQVLKNQGNAALAADFALLRLLAPATKLAQPAMLAPAVDALLTSSAGQQLLRRLELDLRVLLAALSDDVLPKLTWEALTAESLALAQNWGDQFLTVYHVLGALLLHPGLRTFLRRQAFTSDDIQFVLWWQATYARYLQQKQRWWTRDQLLDFMGLGLSWASGFTPFVDQFARIPAGSAWDVAVGHEAQVEELENSLARQRQSNVLVVGQPGTGRLGVIKEVARRVNAGQAHRALNGQRLVYLHLGQVIGLAGSGPEQLAFVSRALREMERAGNIIAILDGLTALLSAGEASGSNLIDVIMPFFSSDTVRVVVIMSSDEYHVRFRNNPDLLQLFEVVQVEPLSPQQTLQLLALTVPAWERRTRLYVPYKALRAVVRHTDSILPEVPFPEKAFDVLEETLAALQQKSVVTVTEADIAAIISRKIGFNVGELQATEKTKLLKLEDFIHQRIVNQESGVASVVRAMIRARAGVSKPDHPIGAFLFLGPTGVGKTETSKALAEAYFGSEEYLQRLDMSEYQGEDAIGRLIGTTHNPTGTLTSLIADHPFTVLLLDEFEKADRRVHLLFLQVFDEGRLSDARGRRYAFNHAIIIATSNAGAEFIRQNVSAAGKLPEKFDDTLREHVLRQDIFRPELLNRFDGVVTFTPLTPGHIRQVAILMLRKLNKRLDAQHGFTVAVTPDLVEFLVTVGYNPEFGARPMARAIQNTVEYAIAQKLLRGEIEPGTEITLPSASLAKLNF